MKSKKQKRLTPAEPLDLESDNAATQSPLPLPSRWFRRIATVLILSYLLVLIIGPLSNPIASTHLTAPLSRIVAPVHRALFMGHGYRFFAPNPSSSHLVQYKVTRADGTQVEGVFPDRDSMRPRLLYHRWFMLSETVFAEHAQTPSPREFEKLNAVRKQQIGVLKKARRFELARSLEAARASEEANYQQTLRRIDALVRSIAEFLLVREQGEEIELTVVTRTIPFPAEIRQGAKLDDKVFLQYEANPVIGRFTRSELVETKSTQSGDEELVDKESARQSLPLEEVK